ncbi:hypothetical protein HPC37_02760 [Pasteurellaceae bacterium 20609_3]|uniref:hypothetical protein n=1 Tax=Spirabiliibacterium mucosae TaxID=28156 RepID=UPI001AAC7636|nr:hypothetical protein [Spirabiliibacterium mucosae]MBE2897775.1 hypothetical protein [Spirabiliibacterium mucosae]
MILWLKEKLYMAGAILAILIGAYSLGHRAARKSAQEKTVRDDLKRTEKTVTVIKETQNEISKKTNDDIHRELFTKWVRKSRD